MVLKREIAEGLGRLKGADYKVPAVAALLPDLDEIDFLRTSERIVGAVREQVSEQGESLAPMPARTVWPRLWDVGRADEGDGLGLVD